MEFGQTILKDVYHIKTFFEKIIWQFKRNILGINPIMKIKPVELMSGRVSNKAKIRNVLYFVRNNDPKITIKDIKDGELIERILDSSMREMKTFNELLLLMKANAPLEFHIPSFEDVRESTKEIYSKAFSRSNNKIIHIPHATTPEALASFVKEKELI